MANLNRSNAPFERRIGASAPDATGIVHLGIGQFHRAHAAVNTALAMAAAIKHSRLELDLLQELLRAAGGAELS